MKIQQAAKAFGVGEREFCDGVSERFRVSHEHGLRVMIENLMDHLPFDLRLAPEGSGEDTGVEDQWIHGLIL